MRESIDLPVLPARKTREEGGSDIPVVVITGATSGVGRAAALLLAKEGYRVVLAGRREEALDEVGTACEAFGARVLLVPTDTRDAASMQSLAAAARAWSGRLDVWINNAGVLAAGAFEETPIEVHTETIRTNLIGYIHGAHAALPYFKEQGHGILINNISVGGWFPTPYAVGYSASKFGLRGYSEALKGELRNWPGIHVCDLYPAFLDTPGIQHAANFTGKVLRPAPPVYDPQLVARAMLKLIRQPRSVQAVTLFSRVLQAAHALFPRLSRNLTGAAIERYLEAAEPIDPTSGNVLDSTAYGTSIHGGWTGAAARRKQLTGGTLALLAVGVVGALLLTRRE
jgi:short-subunit dehydrogenase